MKSVMRFFVTVSVMLFVASGCNDTLDSDLYRYIHDIEISITDASGHDLVAPLGDEKWMPEKERTNRWHGYINPERYNLSIVRPGKDIWQARSMEERQELEGPFFIIRQHGEDLHPFEGSWLFNDYHNVSPTEDKELDRQLIYRFTCPEIFGDDAEHDIVTFWEAEGRTGIYTYPKCTKAFLGDKELAVEEYHYTNSAGNNYSLYFIRIVLDK